MRGLVSSMVLLLQAAASLAAPSPLVAPAAPAEVLSVGDVTLTARGNADRYYGHGCRAANDRNHGRGCRTANNRACWKKGFDINTDYETEVPYTGCTRSYTLEFTEVDNWVGPDGQVKVKAMLINGGFPGPTIHANWGDMLEVNVINNLRTNGTSVHWHGIRMLNNNVNDGVNGVTECPIPPGSSKTYRFLAEQYGTTWYHSHFSVQVANGPLGALVIEGPSSSNYDIDLGVLQVADWYYGAADTIGEALSLVPTPPPPSDNVFFNGKHVGPNGTGGEYNRMKLTPGKRHKLRIVNPSVDNAFIVSLVGHNFTVIATDFVPVQPSDPVGSIFVALGQRYEVIIEADQAVDNYWFNVTMDASGLCGLTHAVKPAMIFNYDGADEDKLPTNPGVVPTSPGCVDPAGFEPVISRSAPEDLFEVTADNELDVALATGGATVKWNIHGQSINITWDEPTLEYIAKGLDTFPDNYNVLRNPAENEWSFWLVQNVGPIPHPMHLHGHDFLVVGRSARVADPFSVTVAQFNSTLAFQPERDGALLNFDNPTRRDVTMLQSWGWVVLAYRTDNPGAWLMHCHIAWHISQGLGVQFLERVQDIPSTLTLGTLQPTCRDWEAYQERVNPFKFDSGL